MLQDTLDEWCSAVPGLVRLDQRLWALEGEHAVSFPEDAHADLAAIESKSYWFRHRNKIIASVVERFRPPGRLFDIGGGNGFVALGLENAGFNCVVVEPGAVGADVAQQRGLSVIRAPFQALDLPDASLPAAGMFDVLEHIEDAEGALKRLHRVLQPGGMAYIAVPAYNFLWSEQDVYGGHFRRYTIRRLENDLRKVGFTPVYATYFFAALVPAVFAFRTIPSYLGQRRGGDAVQSATEHMLPKNALGRTLERTFSWEADMVAAGRKVGFGTSCIVAVRKS